jgi:hypothetical protein
LKTALVNCPTRLIWAFLPAFVYFLNRRDQALIMKLCWPNYVFWLIITFAGGSAMLSACGQKGDLYLPDEPESQEQQRK